MKQPLKVLKGAYDASKRQPNKCFFGWIEARIISLSLYTMKAHVCSISTLRTFLNFYILFQVVFSLDHFYYFVMSSGVFLPLLCTVCVIFWIFYCAVNCMEISFICIIWLRIDVCYKPMYLFMQRALTDTCLSAHLRCRATFLFLYEFRICQYFFLSSFEL